MPNVPQSTGTDKKSGEQFTYGGYPVTLHTCTSCNGVYSESEQHIQTAFHKQHTI